MLTFDEYWRSLKEPPPWPEFQPQEHEGITAQTQKMETPKERQEREAGQHALEICREYQRRTIQTGELQAQILKGVRAGEDPVALLLLAARALSLCLSDKAFYEQVARDATANYGNQ